MKDSYDPGRAAAVREMLGNQAAMANPEISFEQIATHRASRPVDMSAGVEYSPRSPLG